MERAAVEVWLGLGLVAPIVQVVIVHLAHAERDMDQGIEITSARLEQEHPHRRILAQPIGQDAAGGSGAGDDVVVSPSLCHFPQT